MATQTLNPSTSASAAASYYRPELDVVRWIAFLLVFLDHALLNNQTLFHNEHSLLHPFASTFVYLHNVGGYGLGLFFVLSAFLICELLLREKQVSGQVGMKNFYLRRVLRIWPLYYLGVALGYAGAITTGHLRDLPMLHWMLFFGAAFFNSTHVTNSGNPAGPLWSVSVEEQFYLLAPCVLKFFQRRGIFLFCVAAIISANLAIVFMPWNPWFNPLVQFEFFAAGILLSLALHTRLPQWSGKMRLLLIAGALLSWTLAAEGPLTFLHNAPKPSQSIFTVAAECLGAVLLLAAFLGQTSVRMPRWATYLGRISYGLYVFHLWGLSIASRLPLLRVPADALTSRSQEARLLLQWIVAMALTTLFAALSYRFVETPFLRLKKRLSVVLSQPAA